MTKPTANQQATKHKPIALKDSWSSDVPPAKTTKLDRLALFITERVGSMGFFLTIFIWTIGWLFWNMFAPKSMRFDPFPGFVLWLFISNMIQLFLMPLIMIGQNLQGRGADQRAKNDYKVNRKAEQEIQAIQEKLSTLLDCVEEIKAELAKR
jgi:uncharacterized membrane protein